MENGNTADELLQIPLKQRIVSVLIRLRNTLLPTNKDNFKQIGIKLLFLVSLIALVSTAIWLIGYFSNTAKQEKIESISREIWHDTKLGVADKFKLLRKENPDFKAWLTADGADVDMPVYQCDNNKYYLKHNQRREYNNPGALYLSAEDTVNKYTNDKNLVIYGHDMKDDTMFSNLKNYRNVSVCRNNPNISLSTEFGDLTYRIYAVFLLNSDPADDNGHLYDIRKSDFQNKKQFNEWVDEARTRSIISTNVDLNYGDSLLTLVTRADDFENARLVVMARRVREDEVINTSSIQINPAPLYPKRWYDDNGLKYPKGE